MKIKVTQENLSRALSIVSRTASTRTTLPILSNVLIRAIDNQLILSSTNLEVSTTQKVSASIQEEGVVTVPARLITDFVSNLPKTNIEITVSSNKMSIVADGYRSNINTTSADDFPIMPEPETKNEISILAGIFKKAILNTAPIASSDNTRPILTGVYMYSSEGNLYMAATDGYRLAEKQVIETKKQISAIIPASTLNDINRVLIEDSEVVNIGVSDDQITINIGDTTINSRLIEGKFIDYKQLIPTNTQIEATVSQPELLRITKISELFARDSAGSITIDINSNKSTLSVHSITSEIGDNTAEVEAITKGEGLITLNSKFLLDAINQIDSNEIKLQFNGKLAPVLITTDNDSTYKHIIMPVKS